MEAVIDLLETMKGKPPMNKSLRKMRMTLLVQASINWGERGKFTPMMWVKCLMGSELRMNPLHLKYWMFPTLSRRARIPSVTVWAAPATCPPAAGGVPTRSHTRTSRVATPPPGPWRGGVCRGSCSIWSTTRGRSRPRRTTRYSPNNKTRSPRPSVPRAVAYLASPGREAARATQRTRRRDCPRLEATPDPSPCPGVPVVSARTRSPRTSATSPRDQRCPRRGGAARRTRSCATPRWRWWGTGTRTDTWEATCETGSGTTGGEFLSLSEEKILTVFQESTQGSAKH